MNSSIMAYILFISIYFSDGNFGYIGPISTLTENACEAYTELAIQNKINGHYDTDKEIIAWKSWCLPMELGKGV